MDDQFFQIVFQFCKCISFEVGYRVFVQVKDFEFDILECVVRNYCDFVIFRVVGGGSLGVVECYFLENFIRWGKDWN